MMNQFRLDGGASAVGGAAASASCDWPPAVSSAVKSFSTDSISSGMTSFFLLLAVERVHQPFQSFADQRVHYGEIRGKSKYGNDNDSGGGTDLFPRGPRHALHLELKLLKIVLH